MPRIEYVPKRFSDSSLQVIALADKIIGDYMRQGLTLTLRQLYYRFVASDLIPNRQSEYKRLGSVINDARLAGLIDWDAIEDRGRNLNRNPHWDSPADIINAAANGYAIDKWDGQHYRVEVWVEKQALESVVMNVASEWDCPSFACKGYTSQSEMWRAAQRFDDYFENGHNPVIIHLGDHDPSGIDMTRDIQDRLDMFGALVRVDRIALNMDQIDEYDPPPNPAKITDSRSASYMDRFGGDSWELDALEPSVLSSLISNAIQSYCDVGEFHKMRRRQERQRKELTKVSKNWSDIKKWKREK